MTTIRPEGTIGLNRRISGIPDVTHTQHARTISPAITNAIYNAVGVGVMSLLVDQVALLRAMKREEQEVLTAWGE